MAENGGQNRVVVTGMGAVTPEGVTLEDTRALTRMHRRS